MLICSTTVDVCNNARLLGTVKATQARMYTGTLCPCASCAQQASHGQLCLGPAGAAPAAWAVRLVRDAPSSSIAAPLHPSVPGRVSSLGQSPCARPVPPICVRLGARVLAARPALVERGHLPLELPVQACGAVPGGMQAQYVHTARQQGRCITSKAAAENASEAVGGL